YRLPSVRGALRPTAPAPTGPSHGARPLWAGIELLRTPCPARRPGGPTTGRPGLNLSMPVVHDGQSRLVELADATRSPVKGAGDLRCAALRGRPGRPSSNDQGNHPLKASSSALYGTHNGAAVGPRH